MNDPEKLEKEKKNIRSILITYQHGCSLSEFHKAYKELIGYKLPYANFNFRTDIEFLESLGDVVHIKLNGREFHLIGIADEKSQHIQKMVCKQKPAKKPKATKSYFSSVAPRFKRNHHIFQRMNSDIRKYSLENLFTKVPKEELISIVRDAGCDGVILSDFIFRYNKKYKKVFSFNDCGFDSLRACIESIPQLTLVTRERDVIVYETESLKAKKTESMKVKQTESMKVKQTESMKITHSSDRQALPADFAEKLPAAPTRVFEFGKEIKYDATIWNKNNIVSNKKEKENINYSCNDNFNTATSYFEHPNTDSSHFELPNIDSIHVPKQEIVRMIPENIKVKLRKLSSTCPQGIFAKDFLGRFEEVTLSSLNILNLGYCTLHEFINDIPDIFVLQPANGGKKDWIIYPVDSSKKVSSSHSTHEQVLKIDLIKKNIRTILEGSPEGVRLQDFLHSYSLNCNNALCLLELGFDNLESFLESIASSVPLQLISTEGGKIVSLVISNQRGFIEEPTLHSIESIPKDVVYDAKYSIQSLPKEADFSKYIPVYTSSIINPGLLYIQLRSEGDELSKLGDDLDFFYKSSESERYLMKSAHIKVGAICAALWPCDQLWYRAQILYIASLEFVKVIYVDYGTTEQIPTTMLRYLKKEFFYLPAQALRSQLAFLKPKNGTMWSRDVMRRLLNLCRDVPLMAKIEEITVDGTLSLVLCDTNGDQDYFINDVLLKENLAEAVRQDNATASDQSNPFNPSNANNFNLLQAYAAAAAAAGFVSSNSPYESLLKQMSMLNVQNPTSNVSGQLFLPHATVSPMCRTPQQSMPNQTTPFSFPSSFSTAPNMYASNAVPQPFAMSANSSPDPYCPITSNYLKPVEKLSPEEDFLGPEDSQFCFNDAENSIFDDEDDDEEVFQQFCKKIETKSTSKKRFVKRIDLGDGYKIHLILNNSSPYASGGDISSIIWINKDSDYLNRMLQAKETNFGEIIVSEENNEELFRQLDLYKVKGVQKITGSKSSVLLYPFNSILKILNHYGHPSLTVRTSLIKEVAEFKADDPIWEKYPEDEVIEDISSSPLTAITDDDKITQMCLIDLMAMKEGICCRRIKLMKKLKAAPGNPKFIDDMGKMDQLLEKVLERMKIINTICSSFS